MRCVQCATQVAATASATAVSPGATTPNPDAPLADAADGHDFARLQHLLERLPVAWPSQPMHWIPRALRSMAGQVLCKVLEAAAHALLAEDGDAAAITATLIARNAGMLLFRCHNPDDSATAPGTTTAVVRRRLLAANAGDWEALAQECFAELEDAAHQPSSKRPPATTAADPSQPLDDDTLARAAARARVGGLRCAANIMAGGPPVHPGPATDEKIRALFHTAPRDRHAQQLDDDLAKALQQVRNLAPKTKPDIRPRAASQVASRLHAAAGPGPSGFRNSYIQLVNTQPQGPRILAAWAQPWARGDVKPWAARMWTHQLCRPFFKADGVGVRPVMCGEALFKFASACSVYAATRCLAVAVGDHQYGAGKSGGAALELADIQAETRARPNDALVSLDIKNAFGSIAWSDALRITAELAPKLAHFLSSIWAPGVQCIWTQTADRHTWTAMHATGSLIQGGPEAHQVFCLVMARMLHDAHSRLTAPVATWAYVDDVTLKLPPSQLCDSLKTIQGVMASHGCELQPKKCHVCIPALHNSSRSEWPAALHEAAAMGFDVNNTCIPLLGSDAVLHTVTLQIGDGGAAPTVAATKDRADRACHLLSCCMQLAQSSAPAGGRWPALCITRDIACRALSYDARILPCSLVLPHARAIADKAWEVFDTVYGDNLTTPQRDQACLPTHLGGLSWPDLVAETVLARIANIIEIGPQLRASLYGRRPDADASTINTLDGADLEPNLLTDAALLGVRPGPAGLPAAEASKEPLRAPAPARHLLSAYLQAAGRHRFAQLWSQLDPHGRTRLLSAGGAIAGQSLLAPPTTEEVDYNDVDIRTLLRWRLGSTLPTGLCRNEPKQGGDRCGAAIDGQGTHCLSCMIGPARYALHHALSDKLCALGSEAGAIARREVFVPEFQSTTSRRMDQDDDDEAHRKAAFLDVWIFGLADLPDLLVDVTFRNAAAPRYQPQAAVHAGAAARKAADEKQRRYPPTAGRRATTFAVESWGRLGAEGEATLLSLRAAADRRDHSTGHCQPGRLTRWCRQLDAIVQRGIARCLQSSLHGLPGLPPARPRQPFSASQQRSHPT